MSDIAPVSRPQNMGEWIRIILKIIDVAEAAGIEVCDYGLFASHPLVGWGQIQPGTYAFVIEFDSDMTRKAYPGEYVVAHIPCRVYTPWGLMTMSWGIYNRQKLALFWSGLRQLFPDIRRIDDHECLILYSLFGDDIKRCRTLTEEEADDIFDKEAKPILAPLFKPKMRPESWEVYFGKI